MSLNKRYGKSNNTKAKQWVIIAIACFCLVVFLAFTPTLARYFSGWSGSFNAQVAQWKITINGVDLSEETPESALSVELVPDTNIIAATPEKLAAGQTGHFDVVISPGGTEVSFSYEIALDEQKSKLPKGMSIDKYAVKGLGETDFSEKKDGNECKEVVNLPESGVFSETDTITVRMYWTWDDEDYDEFGEYEVVVNVAVTQYCGETV